MVLVRGPMMSLGASGSLGNAITFATWKGRPYVREKVVPANPKSGLQVGFRSMFRFLSQEWANVPSVDQATWQELADQLVASPFNAYMQLNQKRWRNYNSPWHANPEVGVGSLVTWTSGPDVTAGVDSVLVDWDINAPGDGWGLIIYRALAPAFTPSISNAVQVVVADSAGAGTWLDSPLVPDTYYYNFMSFTNDGVLSVALGEVNAVVP